MPELAHEERLVLHILDILFLTLKLLRLAASPLGGQELLDSDWSKLVGAGVYCSSPTLRNLLPEDNITFLSEGRVGQLR